MIPIQLKVEAINRSDFPISLESVELQPWSKSIDLKVDLLDNQRFNSDVTFTIPADVSISQPYWLTEASTLGMYSVSSPGLRGLPENPELISARFILKIEDQYLDRETAISFQKE